MQECSLNYIPTRLHWKEKPIITEFFVGDIAYRRCKPSEIENPFASISLRDISNNLGCNNGNLISQQEDVLISTLEPEPFDKYVDKVVCILEVKSVTNTHQYDKRYEFNNDVVRIRLLHDPIPCMYPHCIFRIDLNDLEVTIDNYDITLKRKKQLRQWVRAELAAMIENKSIEQNKA